MIECSWTEETTSIGLFNEVETDYTETWGMLINIYADEKGVRWAAVLKKDSKYGSGYENLIKHVLADELRVYPTT